MTADDLLAPKHTTYTLAVVECGPEDAEGYPHDSQFDACVNRGDADGGHAGAGLGDQVRRTKV
jgi:hypothetical protein